MYAAPGIGLAAPQVGHGLRLAVVDLQPDDKPAPIHLVNPEIVGISEEIATREEGCLSLPGQYADVSRPARVKVRYRDLEGAAREIEAEGLLAACLQHEIDHLDGVLFVDHLSALKRNMILRRLAKELRQKSRSVRLAFMGSPAFALPALRALHEAHEIVAVYCQPPRPAGRGHALTPCPVHAAAARARAARPHAGEAAARPGRAGGVRRARSRGRRGRRLRPDPAPAHARRAPPRLPQHPRQPPAPLARSRPDPGCGAGRRYRDGRDHHADGGRARHRADAAARFRPDRAARRRQPLCTTSWPSLAPG